jgi:hypothetical protein
MATYRITKYDHLRGSKHVLKVGDTYEWDTQMECEVECWEYEVVTMPIRRRDNQNVEPVYLASEEDGSVLYGGYNEGSVTILGFMGTSGTITRGADREPDTGSFTAVQQGLYPSDSDPLPEPLPHAMI